MFSLKSSIRIVRRPPNRDQKRSKKLVILIHDLWQPNFSPKVWISGPHFGLIYLSWNSISRWLLDLKTVQTPSRKFWLECIHPENSIIIEEDAIIGIWIGIPILRRIVNKRYLQRENVLSTPLIHVNSSSTLGRDRGTRMIESSSENN